MTRPDYCPVAQEPCQAMCALSDVRCKIRDTPPAAQRQWVGLIRGVRVDEDKVIITAKGGNDAARALCAALLEVKERHDGD